ncbi:unnamed protein product [Auanema sp. JU1783]|nr:unnamed protein product [Auanema sp. JU1783]
MKLLLIILAILVSAFALTPLEMKDRMAFHGEPSEAMSDAAYNRYLQEVAAQIYFRHNRAAANLPAFDVGRGPYF